MRLNQVTVSVRDIERSVSFYQSLGLQLIVKAPHYARFLCPDGGSTFSIHYTDKLPEGAGIWVYFEHDDLDNYVGQLIAKGIIFEEQPTDKDWLWREARLKDPDGNQLIIYYAGENRIDPPWKIR
ncbi:VOC family protein [Mucilaginibacter sp. HMF5004]|uniref:VOC family protein n=1 Tax=Mucilaginibacter rivuli TaxID=2857527 RepID=UPI001C5D8E10|nr:VOC family protein [Mucilaginibacter rivuli]MBW4890226.1 VOC family protein [Mucilaginibacter rivuli]